MPKGRTVFYCFPDRYALIILAQLLSDHGNDIASLKNNRIAAPLLKKPCVKKILADLGHGKITALDLLKGWPLKPEAYRLTLGSWPDIDDEPDTSWHQITRHGWNLVLQLNFSISHNRTLKQTVPDWYEPLEYPVHPIAPENEITLAWARIDLDLDTGEALIEEIQSDWVRDARYYAESPWEDSQQSWKKYLDNVLIPQTKRWPETMLTAALWFLIYELGIYTVFYHTHDTGIHMKQIYGSHPPRSLYTTLPKKFGFEITHNGPLFIRDSAKKELKKKFTNPKTKWYLLELNK